ncbi:DNA mismatch repair protein MutS [Methyloceanibacter stevinii]|uniref:DNA mismatch repair protein MutS n=1 Tax=Methyloceanibacter stevinii TaxID=1774970 RepID=A0A1E3VSM3_9HYPH|nr:DNA mismatch repair protein MutS [Methyloceanibacter stevinii]ODR95956.1 DNA mismatch repair protein MutS [Methyloceanibacter stevinii]
MIGGTKEPFRAPEGVTPMMAQYLEIKAANADSLLFYRMGDFYEMFFEDASVASRALGIALTKRGKHLGEDIPMCGVPVHAADDYLQKLIALGHRVAVCEQTEDPAEAKKRGAKAVVRRDVVRLVTPGTLTEESLLDARAHNFLTALFREPQGEGTEPRLALASIDISTGELIAATCKLTDIPGELARIRPGEVLVGEDLASDAGIRARIDEAGAALTPCPRAHFDSARGERALKERLGVATLDAFGDFSRAELAALAGLLTYVELTQVGRMPLLRPPRRESADRLLLIDAATRTNLELVRSNQGTRAGSLLAAIDRTVTAAGARDSRGASPAPSTDVALVNARLDAVGYLADEPRLRQDLRDALKAAPDLARSLSRLAFGRGTPRDLGAVGAAIGAAHALAARLLRAGDALGLPRELMGIAERLAQAPADVAASLSAALAEELPVNARDGGFVQPGYDAGLDELRALRDGSRKVIAGLQATYAEATGIKSLKVRHNSVLGYFVEVTALHAPTLTAPPHAETFIHRQTMANAVRFSTTELSDLESKITSAADRALALELEIFAKLTAEVMAAERQLSAASAALAELDHYAGLAELAVELRYVRPRVDDSAVFAIEEGRHPMVEQTLRREQAGDFIGNDCRLCGGEGDRNEAPSALVVTGPNMGGKSTFLRQNALIVVLAQAGAFVPAKSAHIGLVDRLFSRVGAADDLARGRSTFMVEMVETAAILNQATPRSFVVLDEIGRGTATFDGLSIAWAALEYLHEVNRSRVLFATHYHELTALADRLPHAANATVEVKEWREEIVFLYRVKMGAADRSYGIHVAKLAGLPAPVLKRAGAVLAELEKADGRPKPADLAGDLPLFQAAAAQEAASSPSKLEEALRDFNPDAMTPKEAIEALYRLRALLEDDA